MIRGVVLVVFGLVAGAGGSTFLRGPAGEQSPPCAEPQLDGHEAAGATAEVDSAKVDGVALPGPVAIDSTGVPAIQVLAAGAMEGAEAEAPGVVRAGTESRVGGLYGAMKASEAAEILARLETGEVVGILGTLPDRKAASILARMAPERAAEVSRSMLRNDRRVP